MNRYLAEFTGVFFWMLTLGCVSIAPGAGTIPAVAIGGVVAIVTVLCWNVSGAHLNPAVSVMMWRRGLLPVKDLTPYVVFQFLGAGAGAAVVKVLKRGQGAGTLQSVFMPTFFAELLFTLLLCFAFLYLFHNREKFSLMATGGLIGGVVMVGIFAVGAVSGALFNPATTVGSCLLGLLSFKNLLIYWLAQAVAVFVVAYAWGRMNLAVATKS
ncbi:MAG TPA: aquaporin [Verrucomicrobiae bacterium]